MELPKDSVPEGSAPPRESGALANRAGAWRGVGFAVGPVLAAIVTHEVFLRIGPLHSLGEKSPLSLMYPAVMIASLYGGLRAGLGATGYTTGIYRRISSAST